MKKLLILLSLLGIIQHTEAMSSVSKKNKLYTAKLSFQLFEKIKAGSTIEEILKLIKMGAGINTQNKWGNTALMYAAGKGHAETCAKLLEMGADINAQDEDDSTALIWAAKYGRTETYSKIIEMGADINAQDIWGNTAFMCAAKKGYAEPCRTMLFHAIILPELPEKNFKLTLYRIWKKFKCSNDMRAYMASHLELKQLLCFADTKDYRNLFKDSFLAKVDEIAEHTIKALKLMMVKARSQGWLTQELKNLLNPDDYEKNFGEVLGKNIETVIKARKLYLFVRLPKDSSSEIQGSEDTESVESLSWICTIQ